MRIPVIAANWKMNTTVAEAVSIVQAMIAELDAIGSVQKILCPPFISLESVGKLIKSTSVKLGAQNMYYEMKGAYTGEISPLMVKDLCQYVILGHSERRMYFGETNEIINKKLKAALETGISPIFCVGERLEENEKGITREVVGRQLNEGLKDIKYHASMIIAYEPVWAIGTGKAATGKQANDTISFIRSTIEKIWDSKAAAELRILYGGSVTAGNIAEFIAEPDIDGGLVGGASLKPQEFINITRTASQIKSAK
jgi:triosephosphate isomerase (TIM)